MSAQLLKLGGELLEDATRLSALAGAVAALAREGPLVLVHGGGREIDAEMARRGLARHTVDGLRITDAATLDAVVAVVAGTVNTRLVAALAAAGVRAVGLTGADAAVVPAVEASSHRAANGRIVELGLVGQPVGESMPALLEDLLACGYVPVVACLGLGPGGQLLNVNADTFAAHLAQRCGATRLLIAGATAGVLDAGGRTIEVLDLGRLEALVADGTASAGMAAKLAACRDALLGGVAEVRIVDGRQPAGLPAAAGTRVVARAAAAAARDR